MKKIFLMTTILLTCAAVKAQISDVHIDNGYLCVYDENDKKISYLTSGSFDKLLGFSSEFFVVLDNGYIATFDKNCKKLGYISGSSNKFISATGSTFIVESNGYKNKYDKYCKRK